MLKDKVTVYEGLVIARDCARAKLRKALNTPEAKERYLSTKGVHVVNEEFYNDLLSDNVKWWNLDYCICVAADLGLSILDDVKLFRQECIAELQRMKLPSTVVEIYKPELS